MKKIDTKNLTTVALFEDKEVRRERYNDERYFSIIDIISLLGVSDRTSKYRTDLKKKLANLEGFSQVSEKIGKLKFLATDGKKYPGDAANTETILRIIQSIPSPKAEPVKQWLASLGNQRIEEINDPELGIQRARARAIQVYRSRGMTDIEIKQRLDTIDTRNDYTEELQKRGITGIEYGILTNLSYSRSGKNAKGYREFKGLTQNDNLRDHMTRTEMLLTSLSEEAGSQIAKSKNAKGFSEVQDAVVQGAEIAQKAKEDLESKGVSVLDSNNRLTQKQKSLREKAHKQEKLGYNKKHQK